MDIVIRPLLAELNDGDEYSDDYNEEALLFEQGVYSAHADIAPGDTFPVPDGHEAAVDGGQEVFMEDDGEPATRLPAGLYQLSADGKTLKRLTDPDQQKDQYGMF